jgi:hypothetical protein
MTAGARDAVAEELIAFDESDRLSYIEGFVNHPKTTAYWIRDVRLPPDKQLLWEGTSHDEMMAEIERIKARMTADAILAALAKAGFAVVPVEATNGMCEHGSAIDEQPYDLPAITTSQADACWSAMIAAHLAAAGGKG